MNQIDSDEWEIHKLLNRYTDAVNQRDWDTYQACWTEDAVWELHAPIDITKTGIDNILTEARRAVESQELFMQMNHNATILTLDRDTAKSRLTLNEIGKADPKGAGALPGVGGMFILAYYTDDLVKQGGIWKFKQRVYDVVYIDTTTPGGDVFPLHKPSI